jgi:hypothetical protein
MRCWPRAAPWTVIRVEDRNAYLSVLDRASIDIKIEPFAKLIGDRVTWSMKQETSYTCAA